MFHLHFIQLTYKAVKSRDSWYNFKPCFDSNSLYQGRKCQWTNVPSNM